MLRLQWQKVKCCVCVCVIGAGSREARFEDNVELYRYGLVYLAVNQKEHTMAGLGDESDDAVKFIRIEPKRKYCCLSLHLQLHRWDMRCQAYEARQWKTYFEFLCDDLMRRPCACMCWLLAMAFQRGNGNERRSVWWHAFLSGVATFTSQPGLPFQSNQSLLFIFGFSSIGRFGISVRVLTRCLHVRCLSSLVRRLNDPSMTLTRTFRQRQGRER